MTAYQKRKREIIKKLADNATPAERKLRAALTRAKVRFTFQKPLTIKALKYRKLRFYVADFYFPDRCLVVELDGGHHKAQEKRDAFRTKQLKSSLRMVRYVLRFYNSDVFYDTDRIIGIILSIRPVRMIKLNREQKQYHMAVNAEIARQNEIEYLVKRDQDTRWPVKQEMINSFTPKTILRKKASNG